MSVPNLTRTKVIWSPLPGSQALAITCPCNEILLEGTRGPGKTDVQLMFFRRWVGAGYGKFWRGIIFDREYKNLDDLVAKSQRWFPQFGDGARFLSAKGEYRWVWPGGEELLFRVVKKASDYWNYHGQEFPFIGWNELVKYPTSELYTALKSCNRSSFVPVEGSTVKPIPLVVLSTANPYGSGHNWVKRQWIDSAEPGSIMREVTNVYNPRTQQREDVTRTRVRLFCSYKENKYLDPLYIANLENEPDENKRRAWLYGDWDITAGGALDDVWGPHAITKRFRIPLNWPVFRSFDWGSTHPFSVGWWTVANGEEVTLAHGKRWYPVRGSLIRLCEWYGARQIGTNEGLKLESTDVAKGVTKIEGLLRKGYWIPGAVSPGPADNQIRNVHDRASASIATKMADLGVHWVESDKSAGSRKIGLQLIRDRLSASRRGEGPGLYFMDNCQAAIQTLPVLPRDEDDMDDVDTDSEDHVYDEVRYMCLWAKQWATKINVEHPRAAA